MHKIHGWKTRKHPKTGRYEVLVNGEWRSRQYAWQLLRLMEGLCKLCGHKALRQGYPMCRRCARKEAIRKTGKWNGPWKPGKRGRPPKTSESYAKYLPQSRG